MNPKSHKELKKGIAEEVGVHQQVVEDLISFYYGKVRKTLSKLEYPRIYIQGLGTFQLRKSKVEKAIKRNKSMLGNVAKRTYNGFAKSEDIQKDISELESALKQMEEDLVKKKQFRKK
tara:strand:- start:5013 stop:5366 length:354 start_codon:yes stop_codon:yes gene_type:complete